MLAIRLERSARETINKHWIGQIQYDKNLIDLNILQEVLIRWYEKELYNVSKIVANTPLSLTHLKEHEFSSLRELKLPFIQFENVSDQGSRVDFMVNGYKIQEKLRSNGKKCGTIYFNLCRSSKNGTRFYKKGDNDFYWFHMPDKKMFYVIPEKELIIRSFIGVDDKNFRPKILSLNVKGVFEGTRWANEFMYEYDNPNEKRLLSMFER